MARVYGEFYHARGVAAELRDQMLGARTPQQAYEGIDWLYGGDVTRLRAVDFRSRSTSGGE